MPKHTLYLKENPPTSKYKKPISGLKLNNLC